LKPLGTRKLIVNITDEDRAYARSVQERHGAHRLVVFEHISYSKSPVWPAAKFKNLALTLNKKGIKCASIAAAHEGVIKGTIDCRGITWRQSTALLSVAKAVVGVGSGITMLAAAAEPRPRIIELGIADSVSMAGCGYAPSISIPNPSVREVMSKILEVT
jgi:ADP-heptose:LPS heptosyltransferase